MNPLALAPRSEQPHPVARTRAEVKRARNSTPSPLLAAAPLVLALITAVLVAGAFVRMAS